MMEEVFPVALALGVAGGGVPGRGADRTAQSLTGRIERELGGGRFVATLASGETLEVSGRSVLKVGDRVRVMLRGRIGGAAPEGKGSPTPAGDVAVTRPQAQMTALLPLLFGGEEAVARLEVFSSGPDRPGRGARDRAFTFVFEVTTQALGLLQWVVHLKGREVALQVWAGESPREDLAGWAARVEASLRDRGFTLSAPTVLLKRPFQVPAGTLSVRG